MQNTGNLFCFLQPHNNGKKSKKFVKLTDNIDIIQNIYLQIERGRGINTEAK